MKTKNKTTSKNTIISVNNSHLDLHKKHGSKAQLSPINYRKIQASNNILSYSDRNKNTQNRCVINQQQKEEYLKNGMTISNPSIRKTLLHDDGNTESMNKLFAEPTERLLKINMNHPRILNEMRHGKEKSCVLTISSKLSQRKYTPTTRGNREDSVSRNSIIGENTMTTCFTRKNKSLKIQWLNFKASKFEDKHTITNTNNNVNTNSNANTNSNVITHTSSSNTHQSEVLSTFSPLKNKDLKLRRNGLYTLPESYFETRQKWQGQVNKYADISKSNYYNITNDQILNTFDRTNHSEYTKDIISKIKIINSFIDALPPEMFQADNPLTNRKVFVIIDGSVIFNKERIYGNYIEIPTWKHLQWLDSKKERLKYYYHFLSDCQKAFRTLTPFKNIFLLNGLNISDLSEIPSTDKAVYVSPSNIFKGIHWFNEVNIAITQSTKALQKEEKRWLKVQECKMARKRKKTKTLKCLIMSKKKRKWWNKFIANKFQKTVTKTKVLSDRSFTFGVSDTLETEEYIYYSDSEWKSKQPRIKWNPNSSLISEWLRLNRWDMENKITETNSKGAKLLTKHLSNSIKEDTFNGLDILIKKYNKNRCLTSNIHYNQEMRNTMTEEERQKAVWECNKGKEFLNKIKIFRKYDWSTILLDWDLFYDREKKWKEKWKTSIINRNILKYYDITPKAIREVVKFYPDISSFNIPRVLRAFPKLKRNILYEIFIDYKTLITLCICINRDWKQIKKGVDFDTFFNCMPQVKSQGRSWAKKLFKTWNQWNTACIDWEEYLNGMIIMKNDNWVDKIDALFKWIDTDGNGLLSYNEVFDLSVASLQRIWSKSEEGNEIVVIWAEFFANLIFKLVDKPLDDEIPLELIKEKIIEGKSAAEYLEMFICADSFK